MIGSVLNRESTADCLTSLFREKFGTKAHIFCAPGRVNLIGEHTDYNDGFVMPAAIGFYTWVAAGRRQDRDLRAYSGLYDEKVTLSLDELSGPPRRHWGDFVRGVAATLQEAGHKLAGANLVIHGEVPVGAGLSSSASLEVALALALTRLSGLALSRLELVKLCQRAEHEYVGTRCGIMDQFVASFGGAGHALMLDCRSLGYQLLPMPEDLRLVVCNSMVRHELASGEYNLRRHDCETGVKLLHAHLPGVKALRDIEIQDLERYEHVLPEQVYHRCRHVVTENRRVLKAASALETKDAELFGQLMHQSHASLRDDYEVSCKELDLLVELASHGAGVYGARMTGGGFGGCTVNLVRAECAALFQAHIAHTYRKETGIAPAVYL
ncbi:MAG: galactokinase, partial [Candidatus Sulfotelmatobacter sp.]